jgi:hypothetical protein
MSNEEKKSCYVVNVHWSPAVIVKSSDPHGKHRGGSECFFVEPVLNEHYGISDH